MAKLGGNICSPVQGATTKLNLNQTLVGFLASVYFGETGELVRFYKIVGFGAKDT